MKKQILSLLLAAISLTTVQAREPQAPAWLNNVKLSGYVLTQYQYSGKEGAKANTFNIRMARMALDGRIKKDWYWKIQFQMNGDNSNYSNDIRLVDVFAEWQKLDFLKVKAGQFKRPFTFENPMNPIDQGFMGYSQNVNQLAGFADRNGMRASNGRDIGLQLQGDFLKNAAGRNLVHYQVGIFNGQGINTKDVDQQKDIIGGLWVMPVKGMRIGAFGWEGSYSRTGADGIVKLPQHRYALSAEYLFNDWTVRTEYVHATGKAFKDSEDKKTVTINDAIGSKSDGYYALVIAPVVKNKFYLKARYDLYRPSASWRDSNTQWEAGFNYKFSKNIQLNAEYALINNRALAEHNYSIIDAELDFRF